jgi:hypothetical protein
MSGEVFESVPKEIRDLLVTIRVKLPNRKVIKQDISPLVDISYDLLEKQLETTPSLYVFWGMIHAEQEMVVAAQELNLKKRTAEIADKMQDLARKDGLKELRRSDIKDFVDMDEQVLKIRAKMVLEQKTLSKLNVVMDALKMKSEHLRSLSGFKRQELRDSG